MHVIHALHEMHNWVYMLKKSGKKIGFVPTMGYLHKGHLELLKMARSRCDVLVVSIFVNPTQFSPGEDFNAYPRDLTRDMELAQWAEVDCLFLPEASEVYPAGYRTFIEVESLSEPLCGAFRPGHFRGVATVVAKLFNVVQPDVAFFGEKDAQQLLIIRKMVEDLNVPVRIVGCPTVREADGLAMSSRNAYLSDEERKQATALYRSLQKARNMVVHGETDADRVLAGVRDVLRSDAPSAHVEYVEAVDAETLHTVSRIVGKVLIAMAVHVGKARLIDNITIDTDALTTNSQSAVMHAPK